MSEKICEWCETSFKYHVERRSDCYNKHPKNTCAIDKAFAVIRLLETRRGVLLLYQCDEDIQEEILLELADELETK